MEDDEDKELLDAETDENSNAKRIKPNEGEENEIDPVKAEEEPKGSGDDSQNKANSKPPEPPKDYIHVRARRGQATDSHSLAERVRREKISQRMKLLQDLVPGCNKVTGKVLMLDEIINYVQSLQRQVEGPRRKRMAQLKSGWTLLLTNLILEMASAVFDQLGYALVGMVLAFVALLLATAELIHMARKERMRLLPIFHRHSTSTLAPGKPVGTIVEYFGLVGAVWQCVYSAVEYAYARQKKDNPIKMSLLPFIFLSCVVISILIKKSCIDESA
ncbi:hypothetical protein OIU77_007119 [Salix suchowensis]|uniref:BHLH domain-containing protein n=1 Tax=Salix suchowensis TaxID=1278906 RepID=A0ABQ9AN06_9ROSI|nr:hypothetical protein OIU77_007119 [Salix suchowensis]